MSVEEGHQDLDDVPVGGGGLERDPHLKVAAGEPVHLIYDYGTREVVASNRTLEPAQKLKAVIRVLDFGLKERYAKTVELGLAADEVRKLDTLPDLQDLTTTYFLDLRLFRDKGVLVEANFYFLSTKA